ncbi:MAG: hypothetical protein JNM62_12685 [Flavobacteriales bacterium]|nr:hypothetical protein [Flavobacteriales bacterium]
MERLRMKNLLLACTVMLGLQFCFPVTLRAGATAPVAELISLGTKDAEGKLDVHVDLELSALYILTLILGPHLESTMVARPVKDERAGPWLLPVSGLHPSAP